MTNSVKDALLAAAAKALEKQPVGPPVVAQVLSGKALMKRVWHYLKDNPGRSGPQLAIVFKVQDLDMSRILWELTNRKMITRTKQLDRSSGREVYHCQVVGRTYELLPRGEVAKKPKKNPAKVVIDTFLPAPVVFSPTPVQEDTASVVTKPQERQKPVRSGIPSAIQSCTLQECHEIYSYLRGLFKE